MDNYSLSLQTYQCLNEQNIREEAMACIISPITKFKYIIMERYRIHSKLIELIY